MAAMHSQRTISVGKASALPSSSSQQQLAQQPQQQHAKAFEGEREHVHVVSVADQVDVNGPLLFAKHLPVSALFSLFFSCVLTGVVVAHTADAYSHDQVRLHDKQGEHVFGFC